MITKVLRGLFSTFKVPIQSIKRLREETSAPMGECKKALEESEGKHEVAVQWLKTKGLLTSEKRADKQTREGVVASFVTPCRRKAVLLEVNCETDFVAKSQLFLKFVDNLGNRFINNQQGVNIQGTDNDAIKADFNKLLESTQPANIFPEDPNIKNMNEQLKLVISRLQQNIRIRRAITFHSDQCRYGTYVHRPYIDGIGLQACIVEYAVDPQIEDQENQQVVQQFGDDIATQILGSPPKYLNFEEVPEQTILQETQKVKVEMAPILSKAPEHTHQKIISGKLLSNYYSHVLLGCMPYLLSNQGIQVSEYWSNVEHQTGTNITILRSVVWECK